MMQFVVIAEDGHDEKALERRMAARPAHFDTARQLKADNHFIVGGATLDKDGKMTGSIMIVQFESRQALEDWLSTEPYIAGNVWKKFEVKPFRVAQV